MTPQKQYNILKKSGDLEELYPELVGNWDEDEEQFTEIYNTMMDGVKNLDINYDEL